MYDDTRAPPRRQSQMESLRKLAGLKTSRSLLASQSTGVFSMTPRNPDLIDLLGATLRRIEKSGEFSPQDPGLLRFKRSILLLIADLESKRKEDGDDLAA